MVASAENSPCGERGLERYRAYLELLARLHAHEPLGHKVDLSGVVQQTLLEAYQSGGEAFGDDDPRTLAWLRKIFTNNWIDEVRKVTAAARDVSRERSLQAALEESTARLEGWLAAEQASPSQQAVRSEQLLQLAEALAQLPEGQRTAVEMRYLRGLSVGEIAAEMDRTQGAVGQLLVRGLNRLRELMGS